MTKVLFRKFRKGGEIIALFPEEIWNPGEYSIASYMHVGQHGAADYDHIIGTTTRATESEYACLLAELKSAGYDDLRIMKKCRPDYAKLIREFNQKRKSL